MGYFPNDLIYRFYKFLLVFEQYMCQHYVSDIIWAVLKTNLVPVVFGKEYLQKGENKKKMLCKLNFIFTLQKLYYYQSFFHTFLFPQLLQSKQKVKLKCILMLFRRGLILKVAPAWFIHRRFKPITKKSRTFSKILGQK